MPGHDGAMHEWSASVATSTRLVNRTFASAALSGGFDAGGAILGGGARALQFHGNGVLAELPPRH
jgi:hypothetical protein